MDNDVDDYTRIVAKILTEAKDRSGLSFSKIAEQTDIARATVVRALAGGRPITTFYLHELARVFDVSPGDILTEADLRDSAHEHLGKRRDDVALAASDDLEWQARQEAENE